MSKRSILTPCRGFTLTELAVVLVIVALLIGGMLLPLSTQNDLLYASQTQKTLNDIRDALLGYAVANGRLPCPASAASNGVESPNTGTGTCTNPYDGLVPAVTLGITPTDSNGYVVDGWGNPIHYAVAVFPTTPINGQQYPFTAPNGMKTATIASIAGTSPLLSVCACGAAVSGATCSGSATVCNGAPGLITNQAVAVIYSTGKNTNTGGAGAGESQNPNPHSAVPADPVFVWHVQSQAGSPDGEFDDLMVWVSPNILYNRMIAAGVLP